MMGTKLSAMLITVGMGLGCFMSATPVTHAATKAKATANTTAIRLQPTKTSTTYQAHAMTNSLAQSAALHLGEPYVYGGTKPGAFDCSGFTQYLYAQMGVSIPRVAQAQYTYGKKVATNRLKSGDLVFFGTDTNHITHVGLYIGNGQMIDAQNRGIVQENIHASWWNLVGAARY